MTCTNCLGQGRIYSSMFEGGVQACPACKPTLNPKDRAALDRSPLHLLPAAGRLYGAAATADGAAKYGPYNWRDKPISLMGYTSAMERHILAIRDGEDIAQDSGVHHLGHIIATASILLDAMLCGTLIDDRAGVSGPAPAVMKDYKEFPGLGRHQKG